MKLVMQRVIGVWKLRVKTVVLIYFVAIAAPAHSSSLVFDDFNDGNDSGWTRYNPLAPFGANATFSFQNGAYRVEAPASPQPDIFGPGRAGSGRHDVDVADFQTSVDVVGWDDTLNQGFGLLARMQEFARETTDGYWLHYIIRSPTFTGMGSLVLDRLKDEIPSLLKEVPITLDPNQDYRLVFTGMGSALTGQLFHINDLAAPLTTLSITDETYTSGEVGLLVSGLIVGANSPADATFDNFQVIDMPEPNTLILLVGGMFGIFGYRRNQWRSTL